MKVVQERAPKSGSELSSWLNEDMTKCVKNKHDEMLKITRGLVKDAKNPTENTLFSDLWFFIQSHWLNRLFRADDEEKQYGLLKKAWSNMSFYGTLGEELRQIVQQVISEQPKEVEEEDEEENQSEDSD